MKTREELAAEIYRMTLELIGEEGGWDYLDADEQAHDLAIFDIYAAVLAENSAANHRTWQPIETAPRDGTRIIVYRPHNNEYCPKIGTDRWKEIDGRMTWAHSNEATQPTQWMPLPDAPASKTRPNNVET